MILIKKQHVISLDGKEGQNAVSVEEPCLMVTKEPTCAEEGVKTYTCATCKKTKTEPIAKEAHTEVIDEAVAPTCQTEGKTEGIHCSVCKAVIKAQEVIPKLNHNWDAGKVTKEPTCTKEGEKTYTCQDCPATKTEPIEKKPQKEVIVVCAEQ